MGFGGQFFGEGWFGWAPGGLGIVLDPARFTTQEGTTGCGVYDAYILSRGGRTKITDVPASLISWTRVLDETSEGQATVQAGFDCPDALRDTWPGQHELLIVRSGEPVWVGPILQEPGPPDQIQVNARGISAWWDHRWIHDNLNFGPDTDLAFAFEAISESAMRPDPSPALTLSVMLSGVKGDRQILASQHRLAGPELRDLTSAGVHWYEIGRVVYVGGLPTLNLGLFRDDYFAQPPRVIKDGTVYSNSAVVRGAGGGEQGDEIFGTFTDQAAVNRDGLFETVETIQTITDPVSAKAAAEARVELSGRVIGVEQAILAPDAPFPVSTLIPGAVCELQLQETEFPVSGPYRLQSVRGTGNANDGSENVALAFQPLNVNVTPSNERQVALYRELRDRLHRLENGGAIRGPISLDNRIFVGGVEITVTDEAGGKTLTFRNPDNNNSFDVVL